ncbi:MAG: RHS repeat protein [Chitinophagaceae bacterium]|nr:RHS repeat protein [Chitinophagaceae bacterium]
MVTKFVDPLGAAWEYRYNSFNELEAETDPLGHQKQWGNVETLTEANGAFIQYQYGADS